MEVDARVIVISLKVENRIFTNENVIERIYGT
jgi:hypothetical protein